MAQVSLQINGYGYFLGCADGEEEHLHGLAADLDRRIEQIKATAGPSGEARLLLMAALMLSDELYELQQQQLVASPPAATAASPAAAAAPKIGRRLRGIAKRAEAIADSAETPPEEEAEPVAAPPDQP